MRCAVIAVLLWAACGATALAQSRTPGGMPPPPGMSLADSAAMRFPQPVRVGDLVGRDVLQPVESQRVLGTVQHVVREGDGTLKIVIRTGGFLGFGTRVIAVPVGAMVLVGDVMEVAAFTPAQLSTFATYAAGAGTAVPADTVIKVGLAKPSH
jgi:hypothetical protein